MRSSARRITPFLYIPFVYTRVCDTKSMQSLCACALLQQVLLEHRRNEPSAAASRLQHRKPSLHEHDQGRREDDPPSSLELLPVRCFRKLHGAMCHCLQTERNLQSSEYWTSKQIRRIDCRCREYGPCADECDIAASMPSKRRSSAASSHVVSCKRRTAGDTGLASSKREGLQEPSCKLDNRLSLNISMLHCR